MRIINLIKKIFTKVNGELNYFAGAVILAADSWSTDGFWTDTTSQNTITGPSTVTVTPFYDFKNNTSVSTQITDFRTFVIRLMEIMQILIPFLLALSLLYFLWGVFKLVFSGSEDKRKEAVGTITYGVIGLAVMVSVWGLVKIFTSTFFGSSLFIPQLK